MNRTLSHPSIKEVKLQEENKKKKTDTEFFLSVLKKINTYIKLSRNKQKTSSNVCLNCIYVFLNCIFYLCSLKCIFIYVPLITRDQPGVIFEGKILSQARISITSTPETAAPKVGL